jgi:hypothetical protein
MKTPMTIRCITGMPADRLQFRNGKAVNIALLLTGTMYGGGRLQRHCGRLTGVRWRSPCWNFHCTQSGEDDCQLGCHGSSKSQAYDYDASLPSIDDEINPTADDQLRKVLFAQTFCSSVACTRRRIASSIGPQCLLNGQLRTPNSSTQFA